MLRSWWNVLIVVFAYQASFYVWFLHWTLWAVLIVYVMHLQYYKLHLLYALASALPCRHLAFMIPLHIACTCAANISAIYPTLLYLLWIHYSGCLISSASSSYIAAHSATSDTRCSCFQISVYQIPISKYAEVWEAHMKVCTWARSTAHCLRQVLLSLLVLTHPPPNPRLQAGLEVQWVYTTIASRLGKAMVMYATIRSD